VWDRTAQGIVVEYQPQLIARTLAVVYAWPDLATMLRLNIVHKEQTRSCGHDYTQQLHSNSSKKKRYL